MSAYSFHVLLLCFLCLMDPFAVNMMSGTSVETHTFLLHGSMVAYMQDPSYKFHTRRLLWSLPAIVPWV